MDCRQQRSSGASGAGVCTPPGRLSPGGGLMRSQNCSPYAHSTATTLEMSEQETWRSRTFLQVCSVHTPSYRGKLFTHLHTDAHCSHTFIQVRIVHTPSNRGTSFTHLHTGTQHSHTFMQRRIAHTPSYRSALFTHLHTEVHRSYIFLRA